MYVQLLAFYQMTQARVQWYADENHPVQRQEDVTDKRGENNIKIYHIQYSILLCTPNFITFRIHFQIYFFFLRDLCATVLFLSPFPKFSFCLIFRQKFSYIPKFLILAACSTAKCIPQWSFPSKALLFYIGTPKSVSLVLNSCTQVCIFLCLLDISI